MRSDKAGQIAEIFQSKKDQCLDGSGEVGCGPRQHFLERVRNIYTETLNALSLTWLSLTPVVFFLLQQILHGPYQQSDTVTHLFTEAKTPPAISNSPLHRAQGSAKKMEKQTDSHCTNSGCFIRCTIALQSLVSCMINDSSMDQ